MTSHGGVLPLARIQAGVGRTFAIGPDAQERAEGVERVKAAIEAKNELIQVGLKVLRLDAPVVRAAKPCLQIRENKVDDGQELFRHFRVVPLDHGCRRILMPPTEEAIAAGTAAVRAKIDATGYGGWVSDQQCREVAVAVLDAVDVPPVDEPTSDEVE